MCNIKHTKDISWFINYASTIRYDTIRYDTIQYCVLVQSKTDG